MESTSIRDNKNFKYIYATSDIHGCMSALKECLSYSDYDANNEEHLLVICGDLFDRGSESKDVFEFVYNAWQKRTCIATRGNHDMMLRDFLSGEDYSAFNYLRNGLRKTLESFLGVERPFENWLIERDNISLEELDVVKESDFNEWGLIASRKINEKYPELLPFLESMPDYVESDKYIFTHGCIDTTCEDFHNPVKKLYGYKGWEACHWNDGHFFKEKIMNTDKTVVIGHFGCAELRKMYPGLCTKDEIDCLLNLNSNREYKTLIRDDGRIVALDSTVIVSGFVNIYKTGDYIDIDKIF